MRALTWSVVNVFLIAGCASGPLYYHERPDGTRYYQTIKIGRASCRERV